MRSRLIRWLIVGAGLLGPAAIHAASPQSLKICTCWVTSISADGTASTGNMDTTQSVFRWTAGGGLQLVGMTVNPWTTLHVIAGLPHISDDGNVVAATILDSSRRFATAGRWVNGSGWETLDSPLPPGGGIVDSSDASVWGLSTDGTVVSGLFWHAANGSAQASSWTAAEGMIGLPTTDHSNSRADGVSRDGSVLAGWESDPVNGTWQATAWAYGQKTLLDPSGNWSIAEAVNRDGTLIVGQALNPLTGRQEAALWRWNGSNWTQTALGAPADTSRTGQSYANAVSDDGSVVVGFYARQFSPNHEAFLWTPASGPVNLTQWLVQQGFRINPGKLKLINVSGVSADGHILGVVALQQTAPFQTVSLLIKIQ